MVTKWTNNFNKVIISRIIVQELKFLFLCNQWRRRTQGGGMGDIPPPETKKRKGKRENKKREGERRKKESKKEKRKRKGREKDNKIAENC